MLDLFKFKKQLTHGKINLSQNLNPRVKNEAL